MGDSKDLNFVEARAQNEIGICAKSHYLLFIAIKWQEIIQYLSNIGNRWKDSIGNKLSRIIQFSNAIE